MKKNESERVFWSFNQIFSDFWAFPAEAETRSFCDEGWEHLWILMGKLKLEVKRGGVWLCNDLWPLLICRSCSQMLNCQQCESKWSNETRRSASAFRSRSCSFITGGGGLWANTCGSHDHSTAASCTHGRRWSSWRRGFGSLLWSSSAGMQLSQLNQTDPEGSGSEFMREI